jgi:hypothetical protein
MYSMKHAVRRIPGITPATNSWLMELFVKLPYMSRAMLGGIRIPKVPPAARDPNDWDFA